MHVEDRCVVERHADRLELRGEGAGKALREPLVAAAPERDHRRPFGEWRLQARDASAFLIDRHPQREVGGESRRFVGQLGHLIRIGDVSGEQDDAAKAELPDERP